MGGKQSTNNNPRVRTYSNAGDSGAMGHGSGSGLAGVGPSTSGSGGMVGARGRARSLGSVQNGSHGGHPLSIPSVSNGGAQRGGAGSPDSDASTPEDSPHPLSALERLGGGSSRGINMHASSLPVHLFPFQGIKCPVCNKFVPPDDIECHLVMCLTKPRINYNEDVLTEDKGECVICFDDLVQGDTIARLPCLCIYHKPCIDRWFKVNRSCPEHPSD